MCWTAAVPSAQQGTVAYRRVSTTFTAGDTVSAVDGHFDGQGLRHIHEDVRSGELTRASIQFVLSESQWPFFYRKQMLKSPGPGVPEVVEVAFDTHGKAISSRQLVAGSWSPSPEAEALGALRHYRALRAAIAKADAEKASEAFTGTFEATLPAASSPGRKLQLTLGADHQARLTADYLNNQPPIVEEGWWSVAGKRVEVVLALKAGQPVKPATVVFERQGDTLVAVEYEKSAYGSEGLRLTKTTAGADASASSLKDVMGVTWQWDSLVTPVEQLTIDARDRYTIALQPDNKVQVRADCNRGTGQYQASPPNKIAFDNITMTRAQCSPGSHGDRFMRQLLRASTWFVRDGSLYLELPVDSGTLRFVRQP